MSKPIIGVTPLYDIARDSIWMLPVYMDAVTRAGGIPVILPLVADADGIFDAVDGLLLTGGQDVSPSLYGEETSPLCKAVCERRDELEGALLDRFLGGNKPVFGICRGAQFLNVHLGGTLYQDISAQLGTDVKHSYEPTNRDVSHTVEVADGTLLSEITGAKTLPVNSCHHQGIKALAPKLTAMAKAPDGLVEAVSHDEKRFVMAVQWHPEWLFNDYPAHLALVERFVKESAR